MEAMKRMANSNTKRRIAARIPPAVETRIVELAMQQPEFGAKRLLPLLQRESIAISVSSIYNIMRRHSLQNREKRFAKIQAQQALEAQPRKAAANPPPAEKPGISTGLPQSTIPTRRDDRRSTPPMAAGMAHFHGRRRPDSKRSSKNQAGIPLALKLVAGVLFAVLAFSGVHRALKVHDRRPAPQSAPAAVPLYDPKMKSAGETASATPPAADAAIRKGDLPDSDSSHEVFTDRLPAPAGSRPPPYLSNASWPADSPWFFTIGVDEVEAWLADARRLWQEATLDPYFKDNLPAGFTLTGLHSDAIYVKMGLQNGDIIQGVNGESITGPEQTVYFFQKVAQGGEVEIKIRRHRRTRYVSLSVH
jgi:hypothetical protein